MQEHAIDISVGSASTCKTITATTATEIRTGPTTHTTSTKDPSPTDTVSGCQQLYTVTDSDNFAIVKTKFGITLEQFY